MQSHTPRRSTRTSVLGKRSHQISSSPSTFEHHLLTPEQTPHPKRVRISTTELDGDWNKENIPPPRHEVVTPRAARALRRAGTQPSTPTRLRTASSRRASGSQPVTPATATPVTAVSELTFSTPPPSPASSLPVHSRARALLRSTCNYTTHIAGRDQERVHIQEFVKSFLHPSTIVDSNAPTTLYISGSPGTGKTVLVTSVLRDLNAEFSSFKVISINCMALNSVDSLWDRLSEHLEPSTTRKILGRGNKVRGRDAVTSLLSSTPTKYILVLDELDHIAATVPHLAPILSLAQCHPSVLRVIGIANVHTLTSSVAQLSRHGVDGVDTLHFGPYTPSQLQSILQARLGALREEENSDPLKTFLPLPTLNLLTKKVASETGDVRAMFEVLRGAIDLSVDSLSRAATGTPVVTPIHVLSALKAYRPATTGRSFSLTTNVSTAPVATNPNEIVAKAKNLGLQARLALLSLQLASKRIEAGLAISSSLSPQKSPVKRAHSVPQVSAGSVSVDGTQLHTFYTDVLTRAGGDTILPVSRSEFADLIGVLDTVGLVTVSSSPMSAPRSPSKSGRRALGRGGSFGGQKGNEQVALAEGVRCDEVLRGLGVVRGSKVEGGDIREEEVRLIWERERARLKKDLQAKIGRDEDVFVSAIQD